MALWRIRATVDDRPGFLSVLTASLALRKINILSVQVHTTEAGAVDDFLVDAPAELGADELAAAVERGRGRDPWVQPADAYGLVDAPTQVLGLATGLVRAPEELAATLGTLLGPATVSWRPEPCTGREGFTAHDMQLADPCGGTLHVHRPQPAFTPAEYARAHALTALAGTLVRRAEVASTVILADGREVALRPADPADLDEILAMHERCTLTGRYERYLAPHRPTREELLRLLASHSGFALLVEAPHGVAALGTLRREGPEAEIGVLVEDTWQRSRIGTALLRRLASVAANAGVEVLHGHAHSDTDAPRRLVAQLGRPVTTTVDGPLATFSVQLAVPATAPTSDGNGAGEPRSDRHDDADR